MSKDTKIIIGIILATVTVLVGGVFLLSQNSVNTEPEVLSEAQGIEINPGSYDLGEVPLNKGIVTREYEFKNMGGKVMKLKKVATSCMCTTAKVVLGEKESKFFGMEGHGDANPSLNWEISEGTSAKVVVNFDPAAHGPQGTGPFERIVWLTFDRGIKELTFKGVVVK